MAKEKTRYTEEFKQSIARMVDEGRTPLHIANEYNISHTSVANWCTKYGTSPKYGHNREKAGHDADIKRLKQENYRLSMELDILKKAAAIMLKD